METPFLLTPFEQMAFLLLALFSIGATYNAFMEGWQIINRGEGKLYLDNFLRRAWKALVIYLGQATTLKTRRISSLFHLGIVWGFTFYFIVNGFDVLRGFVPGVVEFAKSTGIAYDVFRLLADVLSVAVLVGVVYFLLRRFVLPNKKELAYHPNVLLHPRVAAGGVKQDSVIVGAFILSHVGARFLGEAVYVAGHGADMFMPFATVVSPLFSSFAPETLRAMEHVAWWVALGGILLFTPYFAQSKHAHLFMAPLNFLTKPPRKSLGELDKLDFEDEKREQFGVERIEQLPKTNIFDAFACIMCNRCQDVCPAYTTGKELSPSALEINKRYMLRDQMSGLAAGEASLNPLMGFAISESAVWACTACGACVDICPVGNEPMFDILQIRRDAVLMKSEFPKDLQNAFKGMERQGNPWGNPESERFNWAKGLDFEVPTVDDNPDFEILYWVGCAPSYDPRSQLTARAFVKLLHRAGVNYAVLGEYERCTGDAARRAGKEDLFFEMATVNIETLNQFKVKRIVATCPHCLHTLGKEYHQYGGSYEVVHHTEFIQELVAQGKLPLSALQGKDSNVTFHDPCYLGRHNNIVDAPRQVLEQLSAQTTEMPRNQKNSFCCGAGGAQFWKEEEHGAKAVNVERYLEAKETGAEVLAVGCPFCMQMFASAQTSVAGGPIIKDIAELVAENLGETAPAAASAH
ncbi:MAG: 4Fe-4S dicluster domain-containing protein [Chloroflexi bacterium]|nr:4Fe-4S dicluster domain-containing protein [Chloroflexota bacterium]